MSDPAKWQVRPEGDGDWEVIQPIPDTKGHYVCIAYGLTKEHAHLIAAAHDMFAALEEMIRLYGDHHDDFSEDARAQARAAIAKATQSHTSAMRES